MPDKKNDVTTNEIMEFLKDYMVVRPEFEKFKGGFERFRDETRDNF